MVNYSHDAVFTALAEPRRRHVLQLLAAGPRPAGELAAEAGLARNAMSRHLGVLRRSGLVAVDFSTTDARQRLYRLRGEGMAEARHWLEEIEREWRDQLERFKAFAERVDEP